MRNKILLLFVFCLILKPSISYSLVEIDITRGNLDPLPIAISPLYVAPEILDIGTNSETVKISTLTSLFQHLACPNVKRRAVHPCS